MQRFDFDRIFKRICTNYSIKGDSRLYEDKHSELWGRFQYENADLFEKAIEEVLDECEFFPKISNIVKSLRKNNVNKSGVPEFPYCGACYPTRGRVTLTFYLQIRNNRKVIMGRVPVVLFEEVRFKEEETFRQDGVVFCLCEAGDWYYTKNNKEGLRLTQKEFDKHLSIVEQERVY